MNTTAEKVFDENGNEIGVKVNGATKYYNTPEARTYFTKQTGHQFEGGEK